MRAACVLGVAFIVLAATACGILPHHADAPARRIRGPMPTRTQEPVKLTFLTFRPRPAQTQPPGTLELRAISAYSSLFENGDVGTERVVLDGELWRNSLSAT